MASDLWKQTEQALAEVLPLTDEQRADYLAKLQSSSPDVHSEVVSRMASQTKNDTAAEHAGDETKDEFHTKTFDPAQTRENYSLEDFKSARKRQSEPSDLVGSDYELEKKIGQGGMGVVYKAYHRSLRRTVALKVITGGGLRDEVDIARFHIEAEAAARLDHPGIIPVYDVGEHNGNHYYAMAYIEGPSLSQFVGGKAKPLPPRRTAQLMEQVCRAVQYAHDRAVIHRDLKPANIMLENGESPRLADFGLAKNMHEDDGLTMTGQVMGTPSYMAPEQAAGKLDEISNRTDVYSLGATLYALLAGKPPFSGGTMLETIRQVVRAEPEPITSVTHTVPRDLQIICEKCLAKNPHDRYASADEMADDLRRFLDGFPISARPLAPWARILRLCQRNPIEAALISLTATALIVGTIVSVRFGLQANRALGKAKENSQNLRSAMTETFVFASEDVLAQEPGMQKARELFLKTALRYFEGLVELTPEDSASQREMAEAQFMLSKVQMAMGEDTEARESLTAALEVQQELAALQQPQTADLAALAKTHNQLARWAKKRWQSLTQLQQQGKLPDDQATESQQQLQQWQQHAAEVIQLRTKVVAAEPNNTESLRLLASAMMNQGIARGELGYANRKLGDADQARKTMQRAQEMRQVSLEQNPQEHAMRRDLALGYFNMANTELAAADLELEDEPYRQRLVRGVEDLTAAIAAYEKLPAEELQLDTQLALATCYRLRADANFRLLSEVPADKDYLHAERLLQRLTMRNPNVFRFRLPLAETQFNRAGFLFFAEKDEQAIDQFDKCRDSLLQALRVDPNNHTAADQLVTFTRNLAEPVASKQNANQKDLDRAVLLVQESRQGLESLAAESVEYEFLEQSIETLKKLEFDIKQLGSSKESQQEASKRLSPQLASDNRKVQ